MREHTAALTAMHVSLQVNPDALTVDCSYCGPDDPCGHLAIHPDDAPTLADLTTWAHQHLTSTHQE